MRIFTLMAWAAVLFLAESAPALTAAERCESAKLKEAGKYGFCRLSHPTVRHYMRLLGERGVAVHTKASPEVVELTAPYEGLCRAPILEFTPPPTA